MTVQQITKKTYADLQALDLLEGDTGIYELIQGEIMRRASPNTPHQLVSGALFLLMGNFNAQKQAGYLFHVPYDVYFDEHNAGIQPDILFVRRERSSILREDNGVVGAPDLIVEILSKSTVARDRGIKKDLYEQFGVREYWIVDPQARSIEVYALENDRYRLVDYAAEEGTVASKVLEGLTVEVGEVYGGNP
ncbi:MAG: Uma2 family endonuclease [Saprospiraceae bacterium]|nr:Uma2 family endonuclease [Saprospiraceae bacterium]MDW8230891.1 Uma2 family endonuclease [Saprospiraceae bacterium]